ncbi:MAG: phospholipase D-like domain-containing protein [Terriglobia bacterium]
MKLLIQPGDDVAPLVQAIKSARKSVEAVIFRFDLREMERALQDAVNRGVFVRALIAHTNRGGEKNLRKLEMRLLEAGVSVARTDGELVRYHDKLLIVDRRVLYLLAFNFTYLDTERSRSFGIVTKDRKLVQEAVRLFEADTTRQPYTPEVDRFVVSPANARAQLARFIQGAKKTLLIYDLKISDLAMIGLLRDRAKAGVDVRVIGWVTRKNTNLEWRQLPNLRLHTRTIIRDGTAAFIGSQSLRALELDKRREVGVIFRDPKAVNSLTRVFEEDWKSGNPEGQPARGPAKGEGVAEKQSLSAAKAAKRVAKAVTERLPPLSPVLERTMLRVAKEKVNIKIDSAAVEETVKEAVKGAVKEAVRDAIEEASGEKPMGHG